MTRLKTFEVIAGETIRATCDLMGASGSGASTLWSGSETLVGSAAAVSSGNGFYYAVHASLSNTPAWYVNKWFMYAAPNTYVKAQYIKAISPEVD